MGSFGSLRGEVFSYDSAGLYSQDVISGGDFPFLWFVAPLSVTLAFPFGVFFAFFSPLFCTGSAGVSA